MFDEEEDKLLEQHLQRLKQEAQPHLNYYPVSAFDQKFDQQLKLLVIHYSFDFQAIALHLYFKYHQYAHRMKPQAVSYRWYQLCIQEGEKLTLSNKIKPEGEQLPLKQIVCEEIQSIVLQPAFQQKLLSYETAMLRAQELDQEEKQSFMLYKPKFIIDTEFKLERESTQDSHNLTVFMDNETCFQFGSFESPLAAPLPQLSEHIPPLVDLSQTAPQQQKDYDEQQLYCLEEDWQAYESD